MFEKIRKILANETSIDEEEITMTSSIHEDLGVDSMDMYNLMDVLEDSFQLKIPEDSKLVTVGDIVKLIEELQK